MRPAFLLIRTGIRTVNPSLWSEAFWFRTMISIFESLHWLGALWEDPTISLSIYLLNSARSIGNWLGASLERAFNGECLLNYEKFRVAVSIPFESKATKRPSDAFGYRVCFLANYRNYRIWKGNFNKNNFKREIIFHLKSATVGVQQPTTALKSKVWMLLKSTENRSNLPIFF